MARRPYIESMSTTATKRMTKRQADKAIRLATLTAAREASRLGDRALATKLFAECGISYTNFSATEN